MLAEGSYCGTGGAVNGPGRAVCPAIHKQEALDLCTGVFMSGAPSRKLVQCGFVERSQ